MFFWFFCLCYSILCLIIIIIIVNNYCFYSVDKDANWLLWFETQFISIAGDNRQIDFEGFRKALHLSQVNTLSDTCTYTLYMYACCVKHLG